MGTVFWQKMISSNKCNDLHSNSFHSHHNQVSQLSLCQESKKRYRLVKTILHGCKQTTEKIFPKTVPYRSIILWKVREDSSILVSFFSQEYFS